jgi:hypothetical protein
MEISCDTEFRIDIGNINIDKEQFYRFTAMQRYKYLIQSSASTCLNYKYSWL